MKTFRNILGFATLLLLFGSAGFYANAQENDDAYYSPKKAKANKGTVVTGQDTQTQSPVNNKALSPGTVKESAAIPKENKKASDGLTDYERYALGKEKGMLGEGVANQGNNPENINRDTVFNENSQSQEYSYDDNKDPVIVNNYYGYNDDYDYYYSSRIRRFHRPNFGWGYYDPWYSDMYFYNYDPFYWGSSIYFGSIWQPWGFSYYSGWNNPFYNDYYSPYSYYNYGYYSPYYGYYNRDYNNNHYSDRGYYRGQRSSMSANSRYSPSYAGTSARKSGTSNEYDSRYRTRSSGDNRGVGVTRSTSGNNGRTSGNTDNGNGAVRSRTGTDGVPRTNSQGNTGVSRSTDQYQRGTRTAPGTSTQGRESRTPSQERTYTRPSERNYTPSYSRPRPSTSPNYNRESNPGSTNRSTVNPGVSRSNPNTGSEGNTYTRPSNNSNTRSSNSYSTPSRNSNSYSSPSRNSSPSYSSPSRSSSPSYSSPSRSSSPSYSAPSRSSSGSSSPSYSAPSSSSGSSGSSSGGSSSSGSSRSSSSSSGGSTRTR